MCSCVSFRFWSLVMQDNASSFVFRRGGLSVSFWANLELWARGRTDLRLVEEPTVFVRVKYLRDLHPRCKWSLMNFPGEVPRGPTPHIWKEETRSGGGGLHLLPSHTDQHPRVSADTPTEPKSHSLSTHRGSGGWNTKTKITPSLITSSLCRARITSF